LISIGFRGFTAWEPRLGRGVQLADFPRECEEPIKGGIRDFEDARGHSARLVGGATALLAPGEGAL
jgi:hypothetical protein